MTDLHNDRANSASSLAKQLVALCEEGAPCQAILDLVAKIPECRGGTDAFAQATKEYPFLHRFVAICGGGDSAVDVVRTTLELWPDAANVASVGDGDGYSYPLHEACNSRNTPERVIELLIGKTNRSVFTHLSVIQEKDESLIEQSKCPTTGSPLHFYMLSGRRNIEIIKQLAVACPEALAIAAGKSKRKATPLLFTLQQRSHESGDELLALVKCLVEANPSSVRIRNALDRLPIHCACSNGKVTLEVLQLLLSVWPGSIREKDQYGSFPLHHFCYNYDVDEETAVGILKHLVETAPDTVREQEEVGWLPAACAAINHNGLSSFKYLIKMGGGDEASHFVQALENLCTESDGDMTYEEIVDVLAIVPEYGTNAVREAMKSSPSILYNFVSHWCQDDESTVKIVEILLELFPEAVNIPVTTKYDENSYPLHAACHGHGMPGRVVEMLVERSNPSVLSHLCILGNGVLENTIGDQEVAGCPLHYYVAREDARCDLEVVKILVKACPVALTVEVDDTPERVTPLHATLHSPYDCGRNSDVVEFLIRLNPSAVRIRDGHGRLPIHTACLNQYATLDVVKHLLGRWPESVWERDSDGLLPLHYLCHNMHWYYNEGGETNMVDILKYIFAAAPESARERGQGWFPIHTAAAHHCADFLRVLIDHFPRSERIEDDDCPLPLFRTCHFGKFGGGKAAKYLLELYPESSRMELNGKCPLEVALCSKENRRADVVRGLLEFDPSFASQEMSMGSYPLHLACENASDLEVLKSLFDAHPDAILVADPAGKTPLDLAKDALNGNGGARKMVTSFLETQYAYAVKVEDRHALTFVDESNRLLLHRALHDKDVSRGAIKLIVRGYPDAVKVADKLGLYPLHAAFRSSSLDVIQYVLDVDGSALKRLDEDGNNALHHACRGGNCPAVSFLLEQHASMAFVENKKGLLPLHLLFLCDSAREKAQYIEKRRYVDAVRQLLLAYPEALSSATASACLDEHESDCMNI